MFVSGMCLSRGYVSLGNMFVLGYVCLGDMSGVTFPDAIVWTSSLVKCFRRAE